MATVSAGSLPTQWWYLVTEDVIWWTANADSHMLNHMAGRSSQKLGKLRLELTDSSMNSLPAGSLLTCPLGGLLGLSDGRKLRAAGSRVLKRDGGGLVVLGVPPVAPSVCDMML